MGFSPHSANSAPQGHLEVRGHKIKGTPLTYPGVRGELKESVQTQDGTVLKAGTKVIIQPTDRQQKEKFEFIITPYKKNKSKAKSDLPESQREVATEPSHRVTIKNPEMILNFNCEHFRRVEDDLFPNKNSPSFDEIIQSRIPDCFLLAVIQSIIALPGGKSFIRGLMRQNEDGSTTVRLFDPVTLLPEYIRVENSIIIDEGGELNRHKALWIHIIEKAYAARGKRSGKQVDASFSSVFSEGGELNIAFRSLLGLKAKDFHLKPSFWDIEKFLKEKKFYPELLYFLENQIPMPSIINYIGASLSQKEISAIYATFNVDTDQTEENDLAVQKYVDLINFHQKHPEAYNAALKNKTTKEIAKLNPRIAATLDEIFIKHRAFSGCYTSYQKEVYENIATEIAQKKSLSAGTTDNLPENLLGLVGPHAYTILDTFDKEVQIKSENGEIKTITAHFIKLRNPWGEKVNSRQNPRGRGYKQHVKHLDIRAEAIDAPEFNIELSEFCKYFSHYSVSESAVDVFQRDVLKEFCISNVSELESQLGVDFTSSPIELITANEQYTKTFNALLDFELLLLDTFDAEQVKDINRIFSRDYDTQIEQLCITGLFEADKFPMVSGESEQVKLHVYALLKLSWMRGQPNKNETEKERLLDIVQQHATQPALWEKLTTSKLILHTILISRMNHYEKLFDYMDELSIQLKKDMQEFRRLIDPAAPTQPILIDAIIEKMIANFTSLERHFIQFLNLNVVVKHFGYTCNADEKIKLFSEIIESCNNLIQPIIKVKPIFNELWNLHTEIRQQAADMEQKHIITPDEKDKINLAVNAVFSGKLKSVGEDLLCSSLDEKRDLGSKLLKANALVALINYMVSCFRNVSIKISTFFSSKNKYELPAQTNDMSAGVKRSR
jgi:hypothetical protein